MNKWIRSVALISALSLNPFPVMAANLIAGPMIGDTSSSQAQIWVQTDTAAQYQVRYWEATQSESNAQLSESKKTLDDEYFASWVWLNGLSPNTRYDYQILLDGQPLESKYPLSFKTAPVITAEQVNLPEFNFLVGSCFYVDDPLLKLLNISYGSGMEIFDSMNKMGGDLMFWLGDNIYLAPFDLSSRYNMNQRYIKHRTLPEIQPLLASMPQWAVWDDHDFGPNNSNTTFWRKDDSLALFQLYWPNAEYGTPKTPGIFYTKQWGDVEFFATDGRLYRSPNDDPDPKRPYFGREQMNWLKDKLKSSQATFKVIVVGSPTFQRYYDESLIQAEAEFDELIGFLTTENIKGVVFLSGDRHHTHLIKYERPGAYALIDYTSSPLTSNPTKLLEPEEAEDPWMLAETLIMDRNFGRLHVSGNKGSRILSLESYTPKGDLIWKHDLTQADLGY